MLLKSFTTVFPQTTIWKSPEVNGVFAIGTKEKLKIDREKLRLRIQSPTVQDDVKGFVQAKAPFDEDYLLKLFLFNSNRIRALSKGGPTLSDDTPYIEHPLITWWFNPKRLDVKKLFLLGTDDIREYVVTAGK